MWIKNSKLHMQVWTISVEIVFNGYQRRHKKVFDVHSTEIHKILLYVFKVDGSKCFQMFKALPNVSNKISRFALEFARWSESRTRKYIGVRLPYSLERLGRNLFATKERLSSVLYNTYGASYKFALVNWRSEKIGPSSTVPIYIEHLQNRKLMSVVTSWKSEALYYFLK